jgi:predicted kinase
MKRILIIVRGLPGSTKSSFAELLGTKAICTADDYHVLNGEYKWIVERARTAHVWCQRKCRRFMQAQAERIVVANTSTTAKELKPYMDLANEYGYFVYSVVMENRMNTKNIHNVPEETLVKMKNRFDIKLI